MGQRFQAAVGDIAVSTVDDLIEDVVVCVRCGTNLTADVDNLHLSEDHLRSVQRPAVANGLDKQGLCVRTSAFGRTQRSPIMYIMSTCVRRYLPSGAYLRAGRPVAASIC